MPNPVIPLDPAFEMQEFFVDIRHVFIAPFGNLPEIEHSDFVEKFGEDRADTYNPGEVVSFAEGGMGEKVGLVIRAPGFGDRFCAAAGQCLHFSGRQGAGCARA